MESTPKERAQIRKEALSKLGKENRQARKKARSSRMRRAGITGPLHK